MGEHQGDRGPDRQPRKGSPRRGKAGCQSGTGGPKSKHQRDTALELLLRPGPKGRAKKVAEEMGVSERTVTRWLADPGFSSDLASRQAEIRREAERIIATDTAEAAGRMVRLSRRATKEDMARVKATEILLGCAGIVKQAPVVEVNNGNGALAELEKLPDEELERRILKAAAAIQRRRELHALG